MATVIEQEPLYPQLPVGQEVIFVVSNSTIVGVQTNVRFIADVYVSDTTPTAISTTSTPTATFKTTPNNAGVGIFDFRQVVENYVSSDNMAANNSKYKTTLTTDSTSHPIHLINQYSRNKKAARWLNIEFKTQYTDANGDVQIDTPIVANDNYRLFNSYLKHSDILTMGIGSTANNFGFNLGIFNLSSPSHRFLTNAPATQYANLEDYGTLAFLAPNNFVSYIQLIYKNSAGVQIGTEDVDKDFANGAYAALGSEISNRLLYFGCFPANLQNWSSTFNALVSPVDQMSGGSILVRAFDVSNTAISKTYTINVNCPDLKGFESIRLCWLNQWGAWDYYTFTKKSVRSISTKGSTYEQLAGSWNEAAYRVDSYKGGKKAFRVNATEKIKLNTDFVSADENIMFEELINSPEVYILEGYQTDGTFSALNQYVKPVRLTTSSFTKKTVANDKLIQYSFEVEKSKTLRTQSV
jgi:hypothetical protein|tara:strand:- start:292 stop:1692 length:1401 start_codon:yes stop_codon:yes gene_type:complete